MGKQESHFFRFLATFLTSAEKVLILSSLCIFFSHALLSVQNALYDTHLFTQLSKSFSSFKFQFKCHLFFETFLRPPLRQTPLLPCVPSVLCSSRYQLFHLGLINTYINFFTTRDQSFQNQYIFTVFQSLLKVIKGLQANVYFSC